MHGWGVTEALAGLPDWVALLFAVLTQLADAWFVFGGLALFYLLADGRLASEPRRTGATLIALAICALAATVALKTFFGVHRPAGAGTATAPAWLPALFEGVYGSIATGDGFGFPSGHATSSAIVYGGLALYLDRLWTRRKRVLAAAGVVGVVSLSRLVIGVHHLPDVLGGAVAGTAVLLAVSRLAGSRPERAFLAAGLFGVVALGAALVFAPAHPDEALKAAIALGAGAGAAVVWRRVGREFSPLPVRIAVPGTAVLGGAWGGIYVGELPLPVTALGSALAVGAVIALPWLVDRRALLE
ncbi:MULTISPECIES: phosphatase PAP2 family protein [Halolamina]|uniref:PAP2 superfamily protein n=1 Tax=Halolamina pelagica TaxID=699431 RepID=A0A1I5SDD7_9EURY|nr:MULTISPECIES: phosphatase PAP2 family protein [Halolamina]NHX37111.1 phosphatase PAP2 family protein [Halolamina sp. R1-12]SFP68729.1 PAP2 superfamily protein [Halolamina pelagica]